MVWESHHSSPIHCVPTRKNCRLLLLHRYLALLSLPPLHQHRLPLRFRLRPLPTLVVILLLLVVLVQPAPSLPLPPPALSLSRSFPLTPSLALLLSALCPRCQSREMNIRIPDWTSAHLVTSSQRFALIEARSTANADDIIASCTKLGWKLGAVVLVRGPDRVLSVDNDSYDHARSV